MWRSPHCSNVRRPRHKASALPRSPPRSRVRTAAPVAPLGAGLDLFTVNTPSPSIGADFAGPSDATLSWALSAYAMVTAALLIPAGRLADLLGRKRLFMGGLVTFVVASALCAAAPGAGWLIGARGAQAAGGAGPMPTSLPLPLAAVSRPPPPGAASLFSA